MRVFVYFNLHKKLWSVKALEGPNKGRVVAHKTSLSLHNCAFKVSEAGRQRVIREKRKNVHAGVVGYWYDDNDSVTYSNANHALQFGFGVTYNPYKYSTFVQTNEERTPIHSAPFVVLDGRTVMAIRKF